MKVRPPNYLAELFRRYKKAKKMTSPMIAVRLGTTPENVRAQLNKEVKLWRIGDLIRYCKVLGIPVEEAFKSIEKGID